MSSKHGSGPAVSATLLRIFAGITALVLTIAILLRGKNIALFHSRGFIASEQRDLMIFAAAVILTIAVPTILLLYFTAWRYRQSNATATYHPDATRGKFFNFVIWTLPAVFMLVLAVVLLPATRNLQPSRALASDVKPITIQVMAMRWKWLFIYPDQQIATVNYVQIPKNVPVIFDLSADDAPMSSFWIPNLGGQLYAMTGHINRLNLIADQEGDYPGRSAEINGSGFEGMKFIAHVSSSKDFEAWANKVRSSSASLDNSAYDALLQPSKNNQAASYVSYDNSLYARAVMKYMGSHGHSTLTPNEESH
ncbi:MAG: COX aromatic rich motif-containing protein [Candidatus Saccharimonadales bacterium]